jgi:hypothetical protein
LWLRDFLRAVSVGADIHSATASSIAPVPFVAEVFSTILDRLLERAHRIELAGASRRRNDAVPRSKKSMTPASE